MKIESIPEKQGIYDPQFEKDNCGVGFVAHMKGKPSHEIIRQGLDLLNRLEHRGAVGSDPLTGDGAGILIQIPHKFFKAECDSLGIPLPEAGRYGTGLVFLPQDERANNLMKIFEEVTAREGLELLGWRKVPVDNTQIGETAREVEPNIQQIFIGPGEWEDQDTFERKLYIIRKQAGQAIRASGLAELYESYYICSLTGRTFIYKGQLMSPQVEKYFLESAGSIRGLPISKKYFSTWGDINCPL